MESLTKAPKKVRTTCVSGWALKDYLKTAKRSKRESRSPRGVPGSHTTRQEQELAGSCCLMDRLFAGPCLEILISNALALPSPADTRRSACCHTVSPI